MKIPKEIRIAGVDYNVKITDTEKLLVDNKRCYGLIDYDNCEIRLDESLVSRQKLEMTLLHELFHAIIANRGLEFEDEELVAEEFAKGLYDVIKNNKEFLINE